MGGAWLVESLWEKYLFTMDDDYLVAYIRNKNAKLVVTTTMAGVTMTKTYSMRLLKLEPKTAA